jgi:hypothetical protein
MKAARQLAEDDLHGCEASACCLPASRSSVRGSWHRGNRDLVRVSVKQSLWTSVAYGAR